MSKRLGSPYRSGRSPHWLKIKNPAAPAVTREAEEDGAEERNRKLSATGLRVGSGDVAAARIDQVHAVANWARHCFVDAVVGRWRRVEDEALNLVPPGRASDKRACPGGDRRPNC